MIKWEYSVFGVELWNSIFLNGWVILWSRFLCGFSVFPLVILLRLQISCGEFLEWINNSELQLPKMPHNLTKVTPVPSKPPWVHTSYHSPKHRGSHHSALALASTTVITLAVRICISSSWRLWIDFSLWFILPPLCTYTRTNFKMRAILHWRNCLTCILYHTVLLVKHG